MIKKLAHKLLRRSLSRANIELYGKNAIWPNHPEFVAVKEAVERDAIAGIPDDRCFTLYRLAQSIVDVPGNVMECGSRYGKSTRYILAGFGAACQKKVHVFDSFQGLSAPGSEDVQKNGSGKSVWAKHDLAVDVLDFEENLKSYSDRIVIHKGWIPDRFGEAESENFALAHIDVDLYQPTLDSLEFAYQRMSPRGVIVCDDYGSRSCPGARDAVDAFFAGRLENPIEFTSMQVMIVKS